MRTFLIIAAGWIAWTQVFAQSLHLTVVNELGERVAATVRSSAFTTSSETGEFHLDNFPAEPLSLLIESQGYFPVVHTLRGSDWRDAGVPPIVLIAQKPGRTRFVFGGDVMAGRRYLQPLAGDRALLDPADQRPGMHALLAHVKPYLEIADVASVNLETPLLRPPIPPALPKSVTFYSHPALANVLATSGVDYVSLGNNHLYDFAEDGLARTLAVLEGTALAYSGAGANDEMARRPAHLSGYDFYSYMGWEGTQAAHQVARSDKGGAAYGNLKNLAEDLARAKHPSVVSYHGGLEYKDAPTVLEVTRFKAAVDAGADLVVGHHPHVLQGLSLYRDRLLAYSLGNFLFDQYIYSTQLSILLYVWMDADKFYRAEIVPVYLNGYVPTPATGSMRYDVLQRMRYLSRNGGVSFARSGVHAIVRKRDATPSQGQVISLHSEGDSGRVTRLFDLATADPTRPIDRIKTDADYARLGVDLVKRGDFSHWGEFGTQPQVWLQPEGLVYRDEHVEIKGPGRTGLRTFERHFSASVPATVSLSVATSCETEIRAILQRRDMVQSRDAALLDGETMTAGAFAVKAGTTQTVSADFVLPRRATKGIRLLIDVDQGEDCATVLDDIRLIEWRTPWINSRERLPDVLATHAQVKFDP